MPWPKSGHAQLGLPFKGRAIKANKMRSRGVSHPHTIFYKDNEGEINLLRHTRSFPSTRVDPITLYYGLFLTIFNIHG